VPGSIIALLTFPGVMVHELGHMLMLRLLGVRIIEYKLFRFGGVSDNRMGYVRHQPTNSVLKTFLVIFAPFAFSSLAEVLVFVAGWYACAIGGNIAYLLTAWAGLSIGMYAFPSSGDTSALWQECVSAIKKGEYIAVVYVPFVGVFKLASLLSMFWLNLAYAVVLMTLVTSSLSIITYGSFSSLSPAVPPGVDFLGPLSIKAVQGSAILSGPRVYFDGQDLGDIPKDGKLLVPLGKVNASADPHSVVLSYALRVEDVATFGAVMGFGVGEQACKQWHIPHSDIAEGKGTIALNWLRADKDMAKDECAAAVLANTL
jgi:hypothetical protein